MQALIQQLPSQVYQTMFLNLFLSLSEPDKLEKNKGDCTVRQATAKSKVQSSREGEFSLLDIPSVPKFLSTASWYLVSALLQRGWCWSPTAVSGLRAQSTELFPNTQQKPSTQTWSQELCYHNIISDVGEQTGNFLIVPQSTPHATTPQGYQFIRHWLWQSCDMPSCWWLKLLSKTF